MRLSVRQALAPFLLALLAGCGSTPVERTDATAPPRASTTPTWARPELLPPAEAARLQTALAGKTLVARRTDTKSGEVEAVYYGPTGKAEHARVGTRDRFDWSLATRSTPRGGYVYLARNGAGDGAPLSYWPERRAVAFSDGKLGPYFSTAVIADCWPSGLAGAPPAAARPCKPAEEREVSARLDAAVAKVAPLRQAASEGAFTTRVGSVYRNSLGNVVKVTKVDGLDIAFENQSGAEFRSRALLYSGNPKVQGDEKVFAAVASLFPLAEGKRASAWVYNGDWSWQLAWEVAGKETVTTGAGKVEAWRIEHTETALGGGYVGRATIWYAPSLGWTAKWRGWTETDATAPATEWTLVEAKLGPG